MQPTEQAAVHLQNEGLHLPDLVRASFVFRGRTRVRRGCRARRVVRHGAAVHHTDSGVALHHRGRPRARCTTTWLKRPRVSWPSLRGRSRPGGGRLDKFRNGPLFFSSASLVMLRSLAKGPRLQKENTTMPNRAENATDRSFTKHAAHGTCNRTPPKRALRILRFRAFGRLHVRVYR